MINFQIYPLCALLKQLLAEETDMAGRVSVHDLMGSNPPPISGFGMLGGEPTNTATSAIKMPFFISDDDKKRIENWLKFAKTLVDRLHLSAADHRIELFRQRLVPVMTGADYVADVRALREAIEGEIKYRYFYYYPDHKASVLLKFEADWANTIKQFPTARADAHSAVDCWASGQSTASIFHLMRVAEYGLRALARERSVKLPKNKPLEWGDWQAVIDGITKKVDLIGGRKAGKARDAALEFYRGALGEFQAFKDVYRNNVMHTRRSYDEFEAQSVMNRVGEFMRRLSAKISEKPKAIRWGQMP